MLRLVAVLCCLARIASSADNIVGDIIEVISKDSSELDQSSEEDVEIQPRFFPFSASFSLGKEGNAHTFSIAGGPDGIGLSQSATHSAGGLAPGDPGYSSSQSSSLAAGLNGISASDSSAYASNHPLFGQTAHADGNAFSLGDASASAHGDVVNGQATSGAQSAVGSTNSQASSSATGPHRNPGQFRPYNQYPSQPQGWSPVVDYPPRPYPPPQPWSGRPNYHQQQHRPSNNQYWADAPPSYASGNPGDYYYNSDRQKPSLTISVSDDRHRTNNGPSRPSSWYPSREGNSREIWNNDQNYPQQQYQPSGDICNQSNGWYRDPRCRGPRVVVSKPDHGVNGGGNNPVINIPLYTHDGNRRPGLQQFNGASPFGPYVARDPRESSASQLEEAVVVSDAGVSVGAESDGSGGQSFATGHSHSEASLDSNGPSSLTITQVDTSGKGQANAHGSSSSSQKRPDGLQISLTSGSSSANSLPGGSSHANSQSQSSKGHSNSEAKGSTSQIGSGTSHKTPNGIVVIPSHDPELEPREEPSLSQIVPQEFIRSGKPNSDVATASATASASATVSSSKPTIETSSGKKKKANSNKRGSKSEQGPIAEFLTDVSDSVYDFIEDLV